MLKKIAAICVVLIIINFAHASALLGDSCPAGSTFDGVAHCTAPPTTTCPAGTTFNGVQCVSTPTCPAGSTFDGVAHCTAPPTTTCPAGTTFNGTRCVSTPTPAPVTTPSTITQAVTVPTVAPTATTPVAPTNSTPSVTVPTVTVPSVTVPSVNTPAVTTPSVTVPTVTTTSLALQPPPDTSDPAILSQLAPALLKAPLLDPTALSTWEKSFLATIVFNNTATSVKSVNDAPGIIIAGISNTTAVNTAVGLQSSALLTTSFPPLTDGTTIVNAMAMPTYTLPNSTSVVPIIPTVVTTVNQTSGQVVATPPLSKIVPGQEMILPVPDSLIPSSGGLKQLDVQSSPTAKPTGTSPNEWFVAEVDNKIPSSIPSADIDGTPVLFLSIQYPYEQTGVGFNWGDPQNHAKPPTITLVVNKTNSTVIQSDNAGCPTIEAYTLSLGSWTSNGLGETSSSSVSPTQCQVKIQSQHLSKFVFSMKHISTIKNTDSGQFAIGTAIGKIPSVGIAEAAKGNMTTNSTTPSPSKPIAHTATVGAPQTSTNLSGSSGIALTPGFSKVYCSSGTEYVFMTGQYTSGDVSYKAIFIKMTLLDRTGHVLATGNGYITDVNAHQTTGFDAIARYDGSFASCQVEVDSSIKN